MRDTPELAAVGGRIVYAFDRARVNAYGGELGWFGLAWDVDEGAPLRPDAGEADRIWINCSAMLARREETMAAGGFDDTFFYGYEDTDLGWRLRIAGHAVRVVPELIALHHVDAVTGAAHPDIVFHYCKNRLRMLLRNTQGRRVLRVLGTYLLYTAADVVLRGPRAPKLRALGWNLVRWRTVLDLRAQTQAGRRAGDAAIFATGSGRALPPTRLAGQRRRSIAGGAEPLTGTRAVDDRV
jgi:GT2 family glycosyltransferase